MTDIPIKPGLFHVPESPADKPYLIGGRCKVCGYTVFPKSRACVRCRKDGTMEEIRLGQQATLDTFAVMQVGPPEFKPPYIIGRVTTEEGANLFTIISGCEPKDDAMALGEKMELVIEKVKEDKEGNNIIGWKYRPVRSRA